MIIPWALVASLAVGVVCGAWVVRRAGQPVGPALDLAAGVAIPALVAARLTGLVINGLASGALPPIAALLALGSGLSGASAVLAGTAAGGRILRGSTSGGEPGRGDGPPEALVRATVIAAATGLASWSLMSLVRGDAFGLSAPVPLGIGWPGLDQPRIPVGVIDAVILVSVALWLHRSADLRGVQLAARLALTTAAMTVVGPLLRPSLATVDRDVEALLGMGALLVTILVVRGHLGVLFRRFRSRRVLSGLAGVVVLVTATVVLAGGQSRPPPVASDLGAGSPSVTDVAGGLMPGGDPAAIPTWNGDDLRAHARAGTTPLVVNLWASWCPPCHAEAPALARAVHALGDRARVVGLLVDDDPDSGQTFVDRYGLPFPTVADGGASGALGFAGLPTTAVLRPDGSIAHLQVGGVDPGALAAAVDRAG